MVPSLQDVGDPGPEWTSRAGSQDSGPPRRPVVAGLTREMVRGTLKSRPPTRRKPQGEGPRRVTEWGIASRSRSRSRSRGFGGASRDSTGFVAMEEGLIWMLLLAVMAYDRYVAICDPLLYMVVVSPCSPRDSQGSSPTP